MRLDHIYISVKNMDRAIAFYEDLLWQKISHREGNQWADFNMWEWFYLWLIYYKIIDEKRILWNNSIPTFYSDDVDWVFEKIKKYNTKITFEPTDLAFTTYRYYCFECEDTEWNLIEVTNYSRAR